METNYNIVVVFWDFYNIKMHVDNDREHSRCQVNVKKIPLGLEFSQITYIEIFINSSKLIILVKINSSVFLWRRQWQPTPALLPGKSHGRRRLVGFSPWGHEESDTTEQLHFHFSLSCIGEGNGNPLQCSCLENPRDGGAWWAAVYGVAQSQKRLKQLSSSSGFYHTLTWISHGWTCVPHPESPSPLPPHPIPQGHPLISFLNCFLSLLSILIHGLH